MKRKLKISFVFFVFGCVYGFAFVSSSADFDAVNFGDRSSERAHRLRMAGRVRRELVATRLGALEREYPARTISGKGATLNFDLAVDSSGEPVLLEIQEIHDRRPEVFGYSVLVNGQAVYFRSYYEMAAGPNHYFVRIPAEIAALANPIRVVFRNESNAEFCIGKVWAYVDFFDNLAATEDVYRTMPVIFDPRQQLEVEPGVDINRIGTDYDFALEKIQEYKQRYSGFNCYSPAGLTWGWGINYGYHGPAAMRPVVDNWLRLASATQMPLVLSYNGAWFASTPAGPDGQGGYFSDLDYHQIAYNPETKTYRTCLGNSFIEPTFNSEVLLQARKLRFGSIMQYTRERIDFLKARGGAMPMLIMKRCHGEQYRIGGDFGNAIRAAAKADGVELNPEDGVSEQEMDWMDRNLVRYLRELAINTCESVGRDSVLVDRGETVLPESQMADNLYMEAGTGPWYPHWDPERHSTFWRTFNGYVWPSNEPSFGYAPYQRMRDDYAKANGKRSCTNMEWCVLKDLEFIENHYQMGYQFEVFFGGKPYFRDWLRRVDNIDDRPARPPVHLERRLLDVNTRRDQSFGPENQVVEVDNLTLPYQESSNVYANMSLADRKRPGHVIYRVESRDGIFDNDLVLTVKGRMDAGGVDIYGGTERGGLAKLGQLTGADLEELEYWQPWGERLGQVDLGDSMKKTGLAPAKVFYLKIEFPAGSDERWINSVRLTRRWPWKSGHLNGVPFTMRQARITQLWVQDRAVTRRLLQHYRDMAGEDDIYRQAKKLVDACRYRTAYRLLAGEISQVLPARYAVRGHGKLGRYPVEVKLANDEAVTLVELLQADRKGIEFALKSETRQSCQLQFNDLKPNRTYALAQLGLNHYRLQLAKTGAVQTGQGGTASIDLEISLEEEPLPLPRKFSAIYIQGGRNSIKVWLQHPLVSLLDEGTILPVADDVKVTRRRDADENVSNDWPQTWDKVEITLDDSGRVSEIRSVYGRDAGRIRKFHKPVIQGGELSNGVIELENGTRYELGYNYWFTRFRTLLLDSPAHEPDYLAARIKPGSHVEISYCPYVHANGLQRATVVSQPVKPLFSADCTKGGETWRKQALAIENLTEKAFDDSFALVPQSQGRSTGTAVFEIKSEKPLAEAMISYNSRILSYPPGAADVVFEVSDNGEDWGECGRTENLERLWDFNVVRMVDISPAIRGRKRFMLRVLLTSQTGISEAALAKLAVSGVEMP